LRVEACGSVDELNAAIGLAVAAGPPDEMRGWLGRIQNDPRRPLHRRTARGPRSSRR
ncbi:hypothetical protein, partial [Actinophytocola sp.]|uniref:hypothetical protein n=1 Tax=Actinophytocola sp. TaxID=1872138 RepID=UPI0039C8ABE6